MRALLLVGFTVSAAAAATTAAATTATLSGQSSDCFPVGGIASLDIMQDRPTTAITAATSAVALAAVLRAPPH